jgi:hypothetical protein
MSMIPGTPIPTPSNLPAAFVFVGRVPDGLAHIVQHVVAAEYSLRTQGDFLHQPALLIDRSNAQVRSTQIDADCEVRHRSQRKTDYTGKIRLSIFVCAENRRKALRVTF